MAHQKSRVRFQRTILFLSPQRRRPEPILDYLHFNPVKHGLVKQPVDRPWSSFKKFVKIGFYEKDWGADLSQEVLDLECGE